MKKYESPHQKNRGLTPSISALLLLLLLAAMLWFPQTVVTGAAKGLLLWYRTVLPTLLPFLILSQILIESGLVRLLGKVLSPFLKPVFHISEAAAFAVFGGFLCGYPVGAKLAFGLADAGMISEKEGHYLLSFCNNASPVFVMSYIFLQKLHRADLALPSLMILWGSTVVCSSIFRRRWYKEERRNVNVEQTEMWRKRRSSQNNRNLRRVGNGMHMTLQILDDAINGGCETMVRIGGYILTFSVLTGLLGKVPAAGETVGPLWHLGVLPLLEITGGIEILTEAAVPFRFRYVLIMGLTAFGGLCAAFQTRCVSGGQAFPMGRYLTEKLITTVVTSLFAFAFIQLYYS